MEKEKITLEEYNEEIRLGEMQIENGEYYTHDEVVEMSKNWIIEATTAVYNQTSTSKK